MDIRVITVNNEVDTESELSELKQKLILKTLELEEANKLLAELTARLAGSGSELKAAREELAVTDAELMAESDDLKTAKDALAMTDAELNNTTRQLADRVKELAIANENLKMHDRMQTTFIDIAAHELRTPIQPIIGIVELLESSSGKGEYCLTDDDFDIMARSVKRLKRLADDILDVARIEGGTFRMEKKPLDLGEIVATAIKDYLVLAKKSNTRLNYLDGKKTMVSADPNRILQVVSNLIDNAVKFSPNGTVTVSVAKDNQQGIVEVSDMGRGISDEVQPKLFKKFAVKSEKGTGLGLYIAKTIVEAHGGSISGQNNKEKGATFRFAIPLETAT